MTGEGHLHPCGPKFEAEPFPSTASSYADRFAAHDDFCTWHRDQRDGDCICGETGPRRPSWRSRANHLACNEASRIAFGPAEPEQCGVRFKRGWFCSRDLGHDGPCALWPVSHEALSEMRAQSLDGLARPPIAARPPERDIDDDAELRELLARWRSAKRGPLAWLKGIFA